MHRDDVPNLDIRISPAQPGRYSVEMQIGEREFPIGSMGQEVLEAGASGHSDEGVRLFRALVADVALRSAWDQAGALHPRRRIRLRIDDAAPELHALAWETLHDPSPAAAVRYLAADLDTPFSRHVACPWEPLGPAPLPLKVLTAVAAPGGLESYHLAPIDREREQAILAEALKLAPPGVVQHTALAGPCTLAALAAELERGYHVLHLVAHGAVSSDRTGSVMFLEKADGTVERVDAARLARAIDCLSRSLRLVVLMSCNTATRSPTDARFGFAPSLLAAGVPAVLAMQDRMPMPTGAAFTRAFYEELWHSGQIDRAANRARRVVVTERLPGNAVPALYATRSSLKLWSPETSIEEHVAMDMPEKTLEAIAAPEVPTAAPEANPPDMSDEAAEWQDFGGPFRAFHVVRGARGRLQVFALDEDRTLRHRHEQAAGGEWSEWEEFGTATYGLAVTADARGRVAVFALDDEMTVYLCRADAAGEWGDWEEMDGPVEQIAATSRRDGSLVVIAQADGQLHVAEQRGPGGKWEEAYELEGGFASFIVVCNGADHLELFGVEDDGTLSASVQRRPHSDWSDWSRLAEDIRSVHAVAGPDGRLHLFALDVEQSMTWRTETRPGGGWGDSAQLGGATGDVAAVSRRDGVLELFTLGGDGVWRATYKDGGTCEWQRLGGQGLIQLHAVEAARGQVELFALDEAGKARRLVAKRS
jgi:hypothetical protein